jgi:hypothetical protein
VKETALAPYTPHSHFNCEAEPAAMNAAALMNTGKRGDGAKADRPTPFTHGHTHNMQPDTHGHRSTSRDSSQQTHILQHCHQMQCCTSLQHHSSVPKPSCTTIAWCDWRLRTTASTTTLVSTWCVPTNRPRLCSHWLGSTQPLLQPPTPYLPQLVCAAAPNACTTAADVNIAACCSAGYVCSTTADPSRSCM